MKDRRTTITALVGILAWLAARKGIVLPPEIQDCILVVTVGLLGYFAKDSHSRNSKPEDQNK